MPNSTTVVAFALKLLGLSATTATASATSTVANVRYRVALTLALLLPLIGLRAAFWVIGIYCDVGVGCGNDPISLLISDVFIHLI